MTTDAALGRLRLQAGDVVSAREAFAQAAAIAHTIAAHTSDESLRATFLDSSAVREVLDGGGRSESVLKRNGTIKPSGKFFSFEGTYSPLVPTTLVQYSSIDCAKPSLSA